MEWILNKNWFDYVWWVGVLVVICWDLLLGVGLGVCWWDWWVDVFFF